MKRIVLDVDDEMHKMIKIKAAKESKPLSEILLTMIRKWLKKE